ncbi:MAG: hypothetical protein DRJ09_02700, partial [Bacteroidetes bacterium]
NKLPTRYNYNEEESILASLGSFRIQKKNRYGQAIKLNSDSLVLTPNTVLCADAVIKSETTIPDAILVFDWRDSTGNSVFWSGSVFKNFISPDSTYVVSVSLRIRDLPSIPTAGNIKFYIWKRDDSIIDVKKMEVVSSYLSSTEMGLYEPFNQ